MQPDIVQDVEMTAVVCFVTVISIGVHRIFFHEEFVPNWTTDDKPDAADPW